jgi:hypothetical protein
VDLKYKGGVAALTINEVFPEDEGQYVCEATNSMGTAKTTCKLTVKRKYEISSKLEYLFKMIYHIIFFHCIVINKFKQPDAFIALVMSSNVVQNIL